jgi:hypothetical protein
MNKEQAGRDLPYFKLNAKEDLAQTPVSIVRYISELEEANNLNEASKNGDNGTFEGPIFKSGTSLITEERQRQIEEEGWSEKHDDWQVVEELAFAAACYAIPESSRIYLKSSNKPNLWLWEAEWWKPTPDNRIKELVKAGALIAAEIDRLKRKSNFNNE